MLNLQEVLTLLRERRLEDLRGIVLHTVVPLPEDLLNEIFRRRAGELDNIDYLRLHLPGDDLLLIRVKAQMPTGVLGIKLPVKRELILQIEREMVLSPSPVLRLHLRSGLNNLDRTMMTWFQNLISRSFPGNLVMRENLIRIDIGEMLRQEGMDFLIPLIRRVTIAGEAGRILVTADIRG